MEKKARKKYREKIKKRMEEDPEFKEEMLIKQQVYLDRKNFKRREKVRILKESLASRLK